MLKTLLSIFIIFFMGGCGLFVDSANSFVELQEKELFLLPYYSKASNDINEHFDQHCDTLENYLNDLSHKINIEDYLLDNGADCETTKGKCYFYFIRVPQNGNDNISIFEVSEYDLNKKYFKDILTTQINVSFKNSSKNAIQINKKNYLFSCHQNDMKSREQLIMLEEKIKNIISGVIYGRRSRSV